MPAPDLLPGEVVVETYRANRSQGSRSVGGHLMLTDRRVLFYPHKLDSVTGGKSWQSALTSISRVGMAPRGFNPFNGSLRRRLLIDSGGVTEYFVVNKGPAIVAAIERAAAR